MELAMTASTAFLVIFTTAIFGLLGAQWVILIPSAGALTLISMFEHRQYQLRFAAIGMADIFKTFAISNAGVSLVAAVAAYGLGAAVRLLAFA